MINWRKTLLLKPYPDVQKKLSKAPKFARFSLVISLFRCSGKTFLDGFLNLLRCETFRQNAFFNVDFLSYFKYLNNIFTFFRYLYWTNVPQEIAILIDTAEHYLQLVSPPIKRPCCNTYSNEFLIFLIIKNISPVIIFAIVPLVKSKTAHTKFNSVSYKFWVLLPVLLYIIQEKNLSLFVEIKILNKRHPRFGASLL